MGEYGRRIVVDIPFERAVAETSEAIRAEGFDLVSTIDLRDYLAKHEDEVCEALLAITDERGRNSGRPVIVKAYNTVRGSAAKHVKAALPAVGGLVERYAFLPLASFGDSSVGLSF